MPYYKSSTRIGYLATSTDLSATTAILDPNVGHVFGRFGQGQLAMPGINKPFLWATNDASNRAGMLISLFPEVEGDAGLTTNLTIDITVQAAMFETLSDLSAPSQPTKAADPDSSGSVSLMIGAGSLASLIIF